MADANITTSDIFIKQLEYKIQKLSEILEQLDILIFAARQMCRDLGQTT